MELESRKAQALKGISDLTTYSSCNQVKHFHLPIIRNHFFLKTTCSLLSLPLKCFTLPSSTSFIFIQIFLFKDQRFLTDGDHGQMHGARFSDWLLANPLSSQGPLARFFLSGNIFRHLPSQKCVTHITSFQCEATTSILQAYIFPITLS